MKLFKDAAGVVYAFEADGSQDDYIGENLSPITQAEADVLRNPPLTAEQQAAACVAAIQTELDVQAQAKGYDNIVSACSYAAQASGAPFQAEGAAFLAWRSAVWQQAYAKQALVKAGTATMPTPAEAVAAMPALVLPS